MNPFQREQKVRMKNHLGIGARGVVIAVLDDRNVVVDFGRDGVYTNPVDALESDEE